MCLPAARAGAALALPGPIDLTWEAGAQANVAQTATWWGGDTHVELRTPRRRRPFGRRRAAHPHPATGRALCFTGGVDSFYSLLACDHRPTHLLFVHGFDLTLDDHARREAASRAVRDVAAARGLTPIEVETDLRDHPRFASVSWEHTHGAALAAVALLLSAEIGSVVIPPSYAPDRMVPWGSRPDLDPRWSVPGRLRVEHGDPVLYRRERLRAVAADPLVHQHLRVCWAHLTPEVNCGRCEKCVRTMIDLEHIGHLGDVATFPRDRDLPELIDAMDPPPPSIHPMWRDLRDLPLRPEVVAALDRVVTRMGG